MKNETLEQIVELAKEWQKSKRTYTYLRQEMHGKVRGMMFAARMIKGWSTMAQNVNMRKRAAK